MTRASRLATVPATLVAALAAACAADAPPPGPAWTGTMDTLPSGQVVVRNSADPLWREGDAWRVVEVLRIGSVEGGRPDAFGRVAAFEVDDAGRIWIVDEIAQQLIVFDGSGAHLRTIGRPGAGPGEFRAAVDVDLAPDGHVWVVDVGNARISVFDTAGRYLDAKPIPTKFKMTPWFGGGFDAHGRFYAPVQAPPSPAEQIAFTLVRHDAALVPRDTLERPVDPVERDVVYVRGYPVPIPLQGRLVWRRSRDGTVWALITDPYRLFELGWSGDTLRTITRPSEPVPVTEADMERLRERWARTIEREGLPRWWSRIPDTKPPVTGLFFQEERNLWVERQPDGAPDGTRPFDVFDREGRYLGVVRVPFALSGLPGPDPIARDGFLYGVTLDSLDVQYIVKARIVRGRGGAE
ncbi:MAG TPA: 6-bladed beta-propeller [Longimicrobiales bacterium]